RPTGCRGITAGCISRVRAPTRATSTSRRGSVRAMKLTGNTILITGGSGGIGLAFAKKFLELGNDVIVTGRNQAKLDAAAKDHPKLTAIRSDAADPKATAALAREIKDKHPKLNVLFNNAGVMIYRNLGVPGDLDALCSEIDINLSGPIRLVS